MSIIQTVVPGQASGKVAQIYGQIEQFLGRVPTGYQMYSSSPELLDQLFQQSGYYMQHPSLSFPLLASIRLLVSQHNDCAYCIGFNEIMLMEKGGYTQDQIAAAKRDPASAPLDEKDKAMLLFVLKGTQAPKSVAVADLDRLRALGWRDQDILDALYHGARNVSVDIMFNALKVENDF